MSRPTVIASGDQYGLLIIMRETDKNTHGQRRVEVRCSGCGTVKIVNLYNLRTGNTKSCECGRIASITTHGYSRHLLYGVWQHMIQRCINPNKSSYKDYGGRGITVCDEWTGSFPVFMKWALSHGWQKGLKIDRRDNNGNYHPDNCRIVTDKVNNNNKRDNRFVTVNGERLTLKESVEKFSTVCYPTVTARLNRGWSIEDALRVEPRSSEAFAICEELDRSKLSQGTCPSPGSYAHDAQ